MTSAPDALALPDAGIAMRFARALSPRGGRAVVVGGWIRDRMLGRAAADLDLEVHGVSRSVLEEELRRFGELRRVGAAFDVYLLGSEPVQVGFVERVASTDFELSASFERAARRRDLTINSLGWEPLSGEFFDPHGGSADLAQRALRATDAARFGEDPLRVFRVARLAAELEFTPVSELVALCRSLALDAIAPQRIYEELSRMLLAARRPSLGWIWLRELHALSSLPEFARLIDVPQNPAWHPEGCVFTHTAMVLDQAAQLRSGQASSDLELMWAALCHDLGKADTTRVDDGVVRSPGHEQRGAELSSEFLLRLQAPKALARRVAALVRHHLMPVALVRQQSGGRAYRKLARSLADEGLDLAALERVARADQLGRTTPEALAGQFAEGARFLEQAQLHLLPGGPANRDVVLGRHARARSTIAGPELGRLLRRCREVQDELGLDDPDEILDRVLLAEPC